MKFGSKLQFEYPEKCPQKCVLKPEYFYQGCLCMRCPALNCKEPETEEDKEYMPLVSAKQFRDDWAEAWDKFFKIGEYPKLKI